MENELCYICLKSQPDKELSLDIPVCEICFENNKSQIDVYNNLKPILFPEINQITENIYLGNEDCAKSIDLLNSNEITHILVAGAYVGMHFKDKFTYFQITPRDSEKEYILKHFEPCNEFIEKAIENKGKILVHCSAGVSRSPTIVIAYLMKKNKWSFEKTHEFVKEKRQAIFPNKGFQAQLKDYEKLIM